MKEIRRDDRDKWGRNEGRRRGEVDRCRRGEHPLNPQTGSWKADTNSIKGWVRKKLMRETG